MTRKARRKSKTERVEINTCDNGCVNRDRHDELLQFETGWRKGDDVMQSIEKYDGWELRGWGWGLTGNERGKEFGV